MDILSLSEWGFDPISGGVGGGGFARETLVVLHQFQESRVLFRVVMKPFPFSSSAACKRVERTFSQCSDAGVLAWSGGVVDWG